MTDRLKKTQTRGGEGLGPVPRQRAARPLEESTLPYWQVRQISSHDLEITCPRCKNVAVVYGAAWREHPQLTRSCAYCFKTSRLPEEVV